MSNKQNINEIALSTAENIADELIFKSATTFIEDLAKSVPVASLALGLTKAISNYKTAKDQRQLLAFVQETENINNGFIEKFFKDKDNTELGYEILGILDQTYLEKQAQMIFRATKLFKDNVINKQEFDKYSYIITRLNNHLINLINDCFYTPQDQLDQLAGFDGKKFIINAGFKKDFTNPNMELVSFGFLEEIHLPLTLEETQKASIYRRTKEFYKFYEKIFKD
ncbi:hypothetical protein E0H89_04525 [Acinetobacter sp. ANC 3781]|uniref:hypothetical protein n=1 Tax=Acinetobacter sp. ANC 3781 TaxID=2529835 RepID=UPI001039A00B|nr:hypothetical protein [Acinetobacter sp. ANC 3781]TCB78994.1 hypothetical protein E0H89_04525 [Acinetobacter sp. ANC 3781]